MLFLFHHSCCKFSSTSQNWQSPAIWGFSLWFPQNQTQGGIFFQVHNSWILCLNQLSSHIQLFCSPAVRRLQKTWMKKTEEHVVQLLSPSQHFVTPWIAGCQPPWSCTISLSLLKFMSIELVMLSNHLTPCCPLLLLLSIIPSIRVFSNVVPESAMTAHAHMRLKKLRFVYL